MSNDFQVKGKNSAAQFSLTVHRGDGMALLGMNWKNGKPPDSFVGFAIEYKEPKGKKYYPLKNRLGFAVNKNSKDPNKLSTLLAPIQKFRWVHFPRNAYLPGDFTYRVTPVFMNDFDELSYGESQTVKIVLNRETYPGKLNVTFTRGFVSSQAFVDRYESAGKISTLLPSKAAEGLTFKPTHPKAKDAYYWMGFETRLSILEVLDKAIEDDKAEVRMIAYDLNEPEIVDRLKKLGSRLKIIIDNSRDHKKKGSAENRAEGNLKKTATAAHVKRQHMGQLQHNKTIVVNGPKAKYAICGSTNFSWRGFFVQNNNAVILKGKKAIQPFLDAFDNYWNNDTVSGFSATTSAQWKDLDLTGIDAKVSFSPHSASNALLSAVAKDIEDNTKSTLFYSLAFLSQTEGALKDAIINTTQDNSKFVYGVSDRKVAGLNLQKPDGNTAPVYPSALSKDLPEPFKKEPAGGSGIRMHHKFVVIDFDKPSARVYLGSYNFSGTADTKNGENLLLIKDRRIAVSYMIEALTIFDHYHFRVKEKETKKAKKKLELAKPPRMEGETTWFEEDYTVPFKIRDREIFS
jgi:phosphatidylserine/phosphatidylglycerophosphate/cardiolipin synthase-like enzyme